MLMAKELQAPVERLLHALHRRDATLISELAAAFSKEAQRCRVMRTGKRSVAASTAYEAGAWEVLEALAVRANSRQHQNARISVAKLRYALDVLQILARSPMDAMSPGALMRELLKQHVSGIHANNLSRLIARLKDVDLIDAHEGSKGDARTKPVQITEDGLKILERLRPAWRTPSKPRYLENRVIDDNRLYYRAELSIDPVERVRKPYDMLVEHPAFIGSREILTVTPMGTIGKRPRALRTPIAPINKPAKVKYAEQSGVVALKKRTPGVRVWGITSHIVEKS